MSALRVRVTEVREVEVPLDVRIYAADQHATRPGALYASVAGVGDIAVAEVTDETALRAALIALRTAAIGDHEVIEAAPITPRGTPR